MKSRYVLFYIFYMYFHMQYNSSIIDYRLSTRVYLRIKRIYVYFTNYQTRFSQKTKPPTQLCMCSNSISHRMYNHENILQIYCSYRLKLAKNCKLIAMLTDVDETFSMYITDINVQNMLFKFF